MKTRLVSVYLGILCLTLTAFGYLGNDPKRGKTVGLYNSFQLLEPQDAESCNTIAEENLQFNTVEKKRNKSAKRRRQLQRRLERELAELHTNQDQINLEAFNVSPDLEDEKEAVRLTVDFLQYQRDPEIDTAGSPCKRANQGGKKKAKPSKQKRAQLRKKKMLENRHIVKPEIASIDGILNLQQNTNINDNDESGNKKVTERNDKRNQRRRNQRRRKKELKKMNEPVISGKENIQEDEYDLLESIILSLLDDEPQDSVLRPLLTTILTSEVFMPEILISELHLLSDPLRMPILDEESLFSGGFHMNNLYRETHLDDEPLFSDSFHNNIKLYHESYLDDELVSGGFHIDRYLENIPIQLYKKRTAVDLKLQNNTIAFTKRQKLRDPPVEKVEDMTAVTSEAVQLQSAVNEKDNLRESKSSAELSSCTDLSDKEHSFQERRQAQLLESSESKHFLDTIDFTKRQKLGDPPVEKIENTTTVTSEDIQIQYAVNEKDNLQESKSSALLSSCTDLSDKEQTFQERTQAQLLQSTESKPFLDTVDIMPSVNVATSNESVRQTRQPLWSKVWFKWIAAVVPSLIFVLLSFLCMRRYFIRQRQLSALDNNIVFVYKPNSDSINMESENEDNLFSTSTNMLRRGGIQINY